MVSAILQHLVQPWVKSDGRLRPSRRVVWVQLIACAVLAAAAHSAQAGSNVQTPAASALTPPAPTYRQDRMPRVELYIRSSQLHTDFVARLCDVQPDGRSINLCDGFVRLAPGQGEQQPDGSLKIAIELWPTAICFRRGHRLRLQVCSGAHPRLSRNLGRGEPLATAIDWQGAEQLIYHDSAHPSALILPSTSWSRDTADIEVLQYT